MTSHASLTQEEREALALLAGWRPYDPTGNSKRVEYVTKDSHIQAIENIGGFLPPDMLRILLRHYTEKR